MDSGLNKTGIVDDYEEFIWTERYNSEGDFELVVPSTTINRNTFTNGLRLSINDSKRVMIVETIVEEDYNEGQKVLRITGPSYEHVLRTRVSQGDISELLNSSTITNRILRPMPVEDPDASGFHGWFPPTNAQSDLTLIKGGGPGISDNETWIENFYYQTATITPQYFPNYGTEELVPVTPGTKYTVGMWIISSVGGIWRLASIWYDSNKNSSANTESPSVTLEPNKWTFMSAVHTAPSGVAWGRFRPTANSMTFSPGDFVGVTGAIHTSGLMLEPAYFDGSISLHRNYTDTDWLGETGKSVSRARWEGLPEWKLEGTPGDIVRQMVREICIEGKYNIEDKIQQLEDNNIYPDDDIPEPDTSEVVYVKPKPLYDAVKDILDGCGLGFRMVRCPDCLNMKFNVYSGSDRSNKVVFSKDLENLSDITTMRSTYDFRNVAYVYSPAGFKTVFAPNTTESDVGLSRRVLMVDADHIKIGEERIDEKLEKAGREALYEHNSVHLVDGEVPPEHVFVYDKDYYLGDLVMVVGADGLQTKMRITEYIFISDAEGVRSYPTLAIEDKITPGTWYSAEWNIYWQDATGEWGTIE